MFDRDELARLKAARYRPGAWPVYVVRHFRLARRTADARPAAVRSALATAFTALALLFVSSAGVSVWIGEDLGRRLFLWSAVWLSGHCAWLLAHLGLLEDRERRPCLRLGLPNTITLIRSITTPGMVLFMQEGHLAIGFILYATGAVADVVDGALARASRLRWPSPCLPAWAAAASCSRAPPPARRCSSTSSQTHRGVGSPRTSSSPTSCR